MMDGERCPTSSNPCNLSASPMRAWGGQGRQLAGLCQAESYLLEDMGIQDAPYWTEKG